ncbi:hypothetical protein BO94DRAFT_124737 [Aspergillus sclerotioniger CBS 115572]|uniref:Uncharacterized protein n=1 Tax=Aspergillus sclerotioniger CBS 115572 TaxID=1450535 RepID=A0A317WAA8_9EURO|nr:hypothetical protein BO94DRAFT_124737 [Aspergillus sclerotioniger CBS 115572]PWY83313.1 hypothetical protein BO94DRAFT_124737 [Aspergillus sclerotioniger CBS 115572]
MGSVSNAMRMAQLYRCRFCGSSLQLFPLAGHPTPPDLQNRSCERAASICPCMPLSRLEALFFFSLSLLIMIPSVYSYIPRS